MRIAELMASELRTEAAGTRKVLERLPEDKWAWRPHAKSFTAIEVATHLTEMMGWVKEIVRAELFELDMANYVRFSPQTREELLTEFDKRAANAVKMIEPVTDEQLAQVWTMKVNGQTMIERPRIEVLRDMVLNHMVHHRAQLGLYLRLNDIPVPSIYGPSADDPGR